MALQPLPCPGFPLPGSPDSLSGFCGAHRYARRSVRTPLADASFGVCTAVGSLVQQNLSAVPWCNCAVRMWRGRTGRLRPTPQEARREHRPVPCCHLAPTAGTEPVRVSGASVEQRLRSGGRGGHSRPAPGGMLCLRPEARDVRLLPGEPRPSQPSRPEVSPLGTAQSRQTLPNTPACCLLISSRKRGRKALDKLAFQAQPKNPSETFLWCLKRAVVKT